MIASVMERALDAIATPFALRAGTVSLRASAGIALSTPGSTVEQLIHEADLRMYRAKALVARPAARHEVAESAWWPEV
jgi:GGDEF domain-containing protein